LALVRVDSKDDPVLLIVNTEAETQPSDRKPLMSLSLPKNVFMVTTLELLAWIESGTDGNVNQFWSALDNHKNQGG